MEGAINRARQPRADPSSVLNPSQNSIDWTVNSATTPFTSSDTVPNELNAHPNDSALYFKALLQNEPPLPFNGGIVGLLALPAEQFFRNKEKYSSLVAGCITDDDNPDDEKNKFMDDNTLVNVGNGYISVKEASMYMQAVARHSNSIAEIWIQGGSTRFVHDVLQAAGAAACICRYNRSYISSSGILPALAFIATSYRPPNISNSTSESLDGVSNKSSIDPASSSTHLQSLPPPTKKQSTSVGAIAGQVSKYYTKDEEDTPFSHHDKAKGATLTSKGTNGHYLNYAFVELLQCCILALQYRYASNFARRNPVVAIGHKTNSKRNTNDKVKASADVEAALKYFHYLGMVHLGCNDYEAAIAAFHVCLTIPSKVVSAITVSSWKKTLLARCLLCSRKGDEVEVLETKQNNRRTGGSSSRESKKFSTNNSTLSAFLLQLPKATSNVVSLCLNQPKLNNGLLQYHELVIAFSSQNIHALNDKIAMYTKEWTSDGNLCMVKQLLNAAKVMSVRRLAGVYSVISRSKVSSLLNWPLTESVEMNCTNDIELLLFDTFCNDVGSTLLPQKTDLMPIDFCINEQKYQISFDTSLDRVAFHDTTDSSWLKAKDSHEDVSNRVMEVVNLAERVSMMDINLSLSTKYQTKVLREESLSNQKQSISASIERTGQPHSVTEFDPFS